MEQIDREIMADQSALDTAERRATQYEELIDYMTGMSFEEKAETLADWYYYDMEIVFRYLREHDHDDDLRYGIIGSQSRV